MVVLVAVSVIIIIIGLLCCYLLEILQIANV